jgi:hypothetical protein
MDAGEHIAELEAEPATRDKAEDLEKLMFYDQSVYWRRSGSGNVVEREPYCPVCWEQRRRLSHLTPGATKGTYGTYGCQVDGTSYITAEYQPGPPFKVAPMRRY